MSWIFLFFWNVFCHFLVGLWKKYTNKHMGLVKWWNKELLQDNIPSEAVLSFSLPPIDRALTGALCNIGEHRQDFPNYN